MICPAQRLCRAAIPKTGNFKVHRMERVDDIGHREPRNLCQPVSDKQYPYQFTPMHIYRLTSPEQCDATVSTFSKWRSPKTDAPTTDGHGVTARSLELGGFFGTGYYVSVPPFQWDLRRIAQSNGAGIQSQLATNGYYYVVTARTRLAKRQFS